MGMDVDYLAGEQAIEKLQQLLSGIEHGKREKIADDLIAFAEKMEKKYSVKNENKRI